MRYVRIHELYYHLTQAEFQLTAVRYILYNRRLYTNDENKTGFYNNTVLIHLQLNKPFDYIMR